MSRLSLPEHNSGCFKNRLLSAFVLVLLITVALLFYPCYATATTPIRIGLTLGLTGRYSAIAEMQRKGLNRITMAIASVIERHGYPLIVSGASSDRLGLQGYRYLFGLYTVASGYARGFLELLTLKGIDDLSLVSADDPFSLEVFNGTRKRAERR